MSLIIIPAIDLKDGQIVRLQQGRMKDSKTYAADPVQVARRWIGEGARRIHLVDLNGAFAGKEVHFEVICSLAKKFPDVEFEVGGGIRSLDTVDRYLKAGIRYCILGSVAIKDPELLRAAAKKYPDQIILGIDARKGRVATEGWGEENEMCAIDLAKKFGDCKISSMIYTDISKDGMLQGMNLKGLAEMARGSKFPVIASGGFSSLNDLGELKKIPNIYGVIAGKALYEGKIDLKEAISLC